MQVKPDIKNHFLFRMEVLHIVLTLLNALGKIIDGVGLDQAFEEAVKLITFHYSPFLYKLYNLAQINSDLIFKKYQN